MAEEKPNSIYFKCRVFNSESFATHEVEFTIESADAPTKKLLEDMIRHFRGMAKGVEVWRQAVGEDHKPGAAVSEPITIKHRLAE